MVRAMQLTIAGWPRWSPASWCGGCFPPMRPEVSRAVRW